MVVIVNQSSWPTLDRRSSRFFPRRSTDLPRSAKMMSMNLETFRELLTQRPFKPFRLAMSSGQSYEVRHPEMAWLTRSDILVGVGGTDEGVPARFHICSLLHVTSVEPLPTASGSQQAGPG
jgi:hypothetical protein